ncbi:MAG: hypothetical protein ACRD36_10340, partial [Candidatus Acidiferrum sp.]
MQWSAYSRSRRNNANPFMATTGDTGSKSIGRDVRMRGFRERALVDDLIALIERKSTRLPAEEALLAESAGRVLATAIVAPIDVPMFERAAMDGYALRGEESFGAGPYNPIDFEIIGECLPGAAFSGVLTSKQAVRIMTGAPMPVGADTVI